jgi:hypothetical protein
VDHRLTWIVGTQVATLVAVVGATAAMLATVVYR